VEGVQDGRQYALIPLSAIIRALFWGMVLRMASVHEIERECQRSKLHPLAGAMSEDTIRYALERVDLGSMEQVWIQVAKRLKRNGVLVSRLAGGRLIAAVDGIEIVCSFHRCCERCLERGVTIKEKGQELTRIQYYHRIVVVSLVGLEFAVPLGLELMRAGEDEVACAERLLARLRRDLGPRFFDLLTVDALYLRPGFVQKVEAMGWDWVAALKENQPELLAEGKRLTGSRTPDHEETDSAGREVHIWEAPEVYWDTARRGVWVVRSVEERVETQRVGGQSRSETKRSENLCVTSLCKGKVRAMSVYRVSKARWDLETQVFADMTQNWFLKHPAIHTPVAFEAMLLMRFLAYLLFMVWASRQVYSRIANKKRLPLFIELSQRLSDSLFLAVLPRLDSS